MSVESTSKIADVGDVEAARRWAPWLAAYTGATFTEITRLHREDCRRGEGGWSIDFYKKGRWLEGPPPRVVPVHPHLIELGFGSFVETRQAGPLFFPKEPRDETAYAKLAKAVQHGKTMGSIELRHRFVNEMRAAGAHIGVMDAVLGREPEFDKFGFGTPLSQIREVIERLPRMDVEAT